MLMIFTWALAFIGAYWVSIIFVLFIQLVPVTSGEFNIWYMVFITPSLKCHQKFFEVCSEAEAEAYNQGTSVNTPLKFKIHGSYRKMG